MADHNYEGALQEIKDNRERVRTTHDPLALALEATAAALAKAGVR